MNTAYIMLGSNSNAGNNLTLAIDKLTAYFQLIDQSSILVTEPIGKHYKLAFHNQALKILSTDSSDETKSIFKQIEKEMGRTPDSKLLGIIPIDIDLIFWNETLMHEDYNRFPFVKTCVDEVRQFENLKMK